MGSFTRDLRRAARSLGRTPAFTAVIVVTLTLGIGATTALFTLTHALLWRPLPVREPGHLVHIARLDHVERPMSLRSPLVELLREEPALEGLCGFQTPFTTVTINGRMASRPTHAMTGDCFETLGIRPALGRLFTLADDRPGMPKVAVLSHLAWLREYGGRPDILDDTIDIAGERFAIIGVAEHRFTGLLLGFPPQVLFPISQQPRTAGDTRPAGVYSAQVLARRAAGQSGDQVRARLNARWPHLLSASPPPQLDGTQLDSYLRSRLSVTSAEAGIDYFLRDRFGRPIIALMALASLVLFVACLNVAALLLARADERRSELAVRVALGAGRWRLVREAAAESLLLIIAGCSLGVTLAYWGNRALVAMLGPIYEGFSLDVVPDTRVLSVIVAVAAVTLVAFALVPASRTQDMDSAALAAASSRTIAGRHRAQRVFVAAEVALTLVLLVVGAFTAHILTELRRAPLGFPVEHVLTAQLVPLPGGYDAGFEDQAYHHALLDRLSNSPGVEAVALSSLAPLFDGPYIEPASAVGGPHLQVNAEQHIVSEDFFSVMQIPLVAGTPFRRSDRADSPRSVIVSESLARRLFDTDDVVGRRISVGTRADMQSLEILAVARDAVLLQPQARNTMTVYRSFWQVDPSFRQTSALILRARGEPNALAMAVRAELQRSGREYLLHLRALSEQRDMALSQERLVASLSAAFAGLGLTLAGVGIYGLLWLFVGRRTREIGMRVALGATPRRVQRFVYRQAMGLVALGLAAGLPLAWAALTALAALLGDAGGEPITPIVIAISVLVTAASVAAWLPARRASAVDPIEALRGE